jgi:hypothetical protein
MNYRESRMESPDKFQMPPLPLEKEFKVLSIRRRLHELSREELEEFLTEALSIMTRLAHQVTELRDYVEVLEGKIQEL